MKLKQITIALTREQAFEAISRDIHNQTISDIITKLNQLTK
jgi:hypothetical protein